FLVPTQGRSSQLGGTISIPFFINFTPNFDITLESKFTSKEGTIIGAELRHKTKKGYYQFDGSLTNPDKRDENNQKTGQKKERSHLFASGNFKWDNIWNWGFSGAISSDDTYLRKYNINSSDTLQNNIFIEGINGKNYASFNAFFFQGLRIEDDPGETPIIFPFLEHRFISQPNDIGLLFKMNSNFIHLNRKEGIDSTRLSLRGGWHLPSTSKLGDLLTLSLEFKADSYITNDIPLDNDPSIVNNNEFVYRLIPQLSGEWSWPIIKREKDSYQLVEPIVSFAVSPYGGNPSKIPNEDSRSFEFDDTNVFSINRFPGIDRIEGGPRINLGLKYGIYGKNSGSMNILIGQVFRLKSDDTFAERSGLENKTSDYVGRVAFSPQKDIKYYQRLRLDKRKLSLRRNEIGLDLGPQKHKFNLTYISLNRELTADELVDREEISATGRTEILNNWYLEGTTRRDLTSDGGMINSGASIEYSDDCFIFIINFDRSFTRDRDLQPSSSVTFRLKLKNLG
ncbi:MAG: LPS-assembly protein LptD, partial [Alphaproteobacteria bacterium MarineAlpha2_Bin1]